MKKDIRLIVLASIPMILLFVCMIIAPDVFIAIVCGLAAMVYWYGITKLFERYEKALAVEHLAAFELNPGDTYDPGNINTTYARIKTQIALAAGFTIPVFIYSIVIWTFR